MLSCMSKANLVGRDGVEDKAQVVLQVEIRPFQGMMRKAFQASTHGEIVVWQDLFAMWKKLILF